MRLRTSKEQTTRRMALGQAHDESSGMRKPPPRDTDEGKAQARRIQAGMIA